MSPDVKENKCKDAAHFLLTPRPVRLHQGDSYDDRSWQRPEEARGRPRSPHSRDRRGSTRRRRRRGVQPHLI